MLSKYENKTKKFIDFKLQETISPEEYITLAKTPFISKSYVEKLQQLVVETKNDNLIFKFAKEIKKADKEYLFNSLNPENKEIKNAFINEILNVNSNDKPESQQNLNEPPINTVENIK